MTSDEYGPRLVPISQVRDEGPVKWLWKDRIPLGGLTVLEGDAGVGKATLLIDLVARVTSGKEMPGGGPAAGPAGVLLLTAEDALGSVIRPRLAAAGADLGLVTVHDRSGPTGRHLVL